MPAKTIIKQLGQDHLQHLLDIQGAKDFRYYKGLQLIDVRPAYHLLGASFGCIAGALAFLHGQGIKHKDLKPSNILLVAPRGSIYLTDFGTSTDLSQVSSSMTDSGIRGTPRYFAPEVANYEPSGRSADVFSLGCIFLEMLYVGCRVTLEPLQARLPLRDHSFHANLQGFGGLSDDFPDEWRKDPDFALFSNLFLQMMTTDQLARPSALEVWNILRRYGGRRRDGNFNFSVQACCRDVEILA